MLNLSIRALWTRDVSRSSTHTIPFFRSTEAIPSETSHSPLVNQIGSEESKGENKAIWLYPSGVGTMSK